MILEKLKSEIVEDLKKRRQVFKLALSHKALANAPEASPLQLKTFDISFENECWENNIFFGGYFPQP